jgi:hypothetical protein
MFRQYTNANGHKVFKMAPEDIYAAAEWVRSMCHLALGPAQGEDYFRTLGAEKVLILWNSRSRQPQAEA